MARILVLDGHCNASLAFTRSLGRAGHWVAVGYNRGDLAPAALSRYCRISFEYPVPTEEPNHFADAVLKFVREHGVDLTAPMTDWTTFPLVRRLDQFPEVTRLAAGPLEALEVVSDKHNTLVLARELNVPVPETLLVRCTEDIEPARGWPYPVVVKDRFSIRWLAEKAVFGSASYAYSWDELLHRVEQRLERAGDVLVQKFVGGVGVGFSCFVLKGHAHLPFQWERVREENPCGGASSARKSIALDPQILEFGSNLMTRSGFQGIGMVEFKRDSATGQLCLMEINGRPWGSLQLAIESGIDYPRHVAAWFLLGERPPEQIEYRRHITCRRFVSDLDHLAQVRKGRPQGWPGAYPTFWTSLIKVAIPWYPGLRYEDLYLRDLRPGLAELSQWFSLRLKKVKRRIQSAPHPRIVRGIVHCHTRLSYDGEVELNDLCKLFRQRGFEFVALTEHRRGLSARDYELFVRKCHEVSDRNFVAIPGVEFRCDDDVEIAGLGVSQLLDEAGTSDRMVARIRGSGGFAVWVHPWRKKRWSGPSLDCDAVEVLNLKLDGTLAPNLSLLRKTVRERKAGRRFHAIFGVDFHDRTQPLSAWVECQVSEMTSEAIIEALREGRFVSRVPYAAMSSSGAMGILDYALIVSFRSAFIVWAGVLRSLPNSLRKLLVAWSRPIVRLLRGGDHGRPKR